MFVKILYFPLVIALLVFLSLTWKVDESYSIWIIPTVVLLALVYVLSPQINWWWYKRHPPELEKPIRQMLLQCHPYYAQLPVAEKERFRQRVALFRIATDYMPQGVEVVPEDVKAVVAANAVTLTFGREEFLVEPFEKVVVYPRPFPSPQFPKNFHTSEIYEEDGVLLFSADQLMRSFAAPRQFFNIGLYEYAKVFIHLHPEAGWPELPAAIWESLTRISGFSRESITQWINVPEAAIAPLPVSITHFFVFPQAFRKQLPEIYVRFVELFQFDPAGSQSLMLS